MDTNAWEIFERKRRADWDSGKVGFNYIYLHTTYSISIYLLDILFSSNQAFIKVCMAFIFGLQTL